MIYPRNFVSVGDCLACSRDGEPDFCNENNPYPKVKFQGDWWLGHRLSYHLNNSPIKRLAGRRAKAGLVLHTCDNKWCINHHHLYLGTASQNSKDNAERNLAWLEGRPSCHTSEGLSRLASAASSRKGEKRPNSWWKSDEGRAKASEMAKEKWTAEKRSMLSKKAKEFWNTPEGKKIIKKRNDGMDPEVKRQRAMKAAAARWAK